MASVKATHSNDALTIYQGNVNVALLISFIQSSMETLELEEARQRESKTLHKT